MHMRSGICFLLPLDWKSLRLSLNTGFSIQYVKWNLSKSHPLPALVWARLLLTLQFLFLSFQIPSHWPLVEQLQGTVSSHQFSEHLDFLSRPFGWEQLWTPVTHTFIIMCTQGLSTLHLCVHLLLCWSHKERMFPHFPNPKQPAWGSPCASLS